MSTSESIKRVDSQDVVDITNCDREPIHIPGLIQPHGVLFTIDESSLLIKQVSNNTQAVLGIFPEALLEQPLTAFVVQPQSELLKHSFSVADLNSINPIKITFKTPTQELLFDGVLHRSGGLLVLELEPTESGEAIPFPSFYHVVRTSTATLQGALGLGELTQAAAEEVRKITGFDRVMIYRFDEQWNGEVIAEAKRDDMEPYLGLHYPASDIPSQARELYRRNWLRLIADVDYKPAAILPAANPLTGQALDLSLSVLRSVSPMHIEYLKNMGVGASMSVSIIKDDQLWGLISCHHNTARYVPYAVRTVCEFLGQILSLQLSAKTDYEDYAHEVNVRDIQARLLENLLQQDDVLTGLRFDEASLLALVSAQGVGILLEDQYTAVGVTPSEEQVRALVGWLQYQQRTDVFATNSLAQEWAEGERYQDVASGVLAISVSPLGSDYVLWFRPEVVQIVQWGGDPTKPMEVLDGDTLHPRRSFQAWSQTVRQQAQPWKEYEVDAARVLRSAIVDRILRNLLLHRAEELTRLNRELELSNGELDSFAYVASHDLKEPLRGINNYALILKEDFASVLDQQGQERLDTLVRLTTRMDNLIDSLLHYSRVGRVELSFAVTDLNDVVERAIDILSLRLEQEHVEIRIPRPLPTIWCDRIRIGEIYSNLISNAIKYNNRDEKWIEIGYSEPAQPDQPSVLYVRDNGIGIRAKYYDSIFHIFKRLHGREKYGGGTGAGLTIVKRIVERHGGKIWVESTYGEGSTFYFTLQKGPET